MKGGTPTATTYIKPHKQAAKRTAIQSLKDRFDYGLNPEKLGAVSSYRVFDSLIIEKMLAGPIKPVFFCQKICFIL